MWGCEAPGALIRHNRGMQGDTPGAGMSFAVLGPLDVRRDGRPVEVGGPSGYRLAVSSDQVGLHLFARLAGEGAAALAAGDPGRAAGLLREALGLWRGAPLTDLPNAEVEVARLEELRTAAAEDRIEAEPALWPVGPLGAGPAVRLFAERAAAVRGCPATRRSARSWSGAGTCSTPTSARRPSGGPARRPRRTSRCVWSADSGGTGGCPATGLEGAQRSAEALTLAGDDADPARLALAHAVHGITSGGGEGNLGQAGRSLAVTGASVALIAGERRSIRRRV